MVVDVDGMTGVIIQFEMVKVNVKHFGFRIAGCGFRVVKRKLIPTGQCQARSTRANARYDDNTKSEIRNPQFEI